MAMKLLKTAWNGLRSGVAIAGTVRRPGSYLLLFRLENTALLTRVLDEADHAHVLSRISARLGEALKSGQTHPTPPGFSAILLTGVTKARAMTSARHAQLQGERMLAVAGQMITPVLSGLVIPYPPEHPMTEANLIAQGRRFMEQMDSSLLGQITYAASESSFDAENSPPFVALFQPIICCYSGRVTGFELHGGRRCLAGNTDTLISDLQDTADRGYEIPILSALHEARKALRFWDKADADIPRVAINLLDAELQMPDFSERVIDELVRMKLPPVRLVLRIGNGGIADRSSPPLQANLWKLREIGCRIELNGFGIGTNGLDQVRQLAVNSIRIDRSFVFCCDMEPVQQRTIRAILAMAEQMELCTIAEGVESPEEHAFLAKSGCREVQGCAIAPPMPLDQTLDFLAQQAGKAMPVAAADRMKSG